MFTTKRTPPKSKPTLRFEHSVSDTELAALSSSDIDLNVTCRKRKQPSCDHEAEFAAIRADIDDSNSFRLDLQKTLNELRVGLESQLAVINNNITSIRGDLEAYVKECKREMEQLRTENTIIKQSVAKLTEEVAGVKDSAQHISDDYDDIKNRLSKVSERSIGVNSDLLKALEIKIDNLEQQGRQCNLEIANVPERRGENLLVLLDSIGKAINHAIPRGDIMSVHRVPHAASNDRPKNIIATLRSKVLKDNVLSACRIKKGFTSTDLGISGTSHSIYVNEHLTLQRKQLLRETREAARKNGYKYVWVRHSTILVKQSDISSTIVIKCVNDINKIKPIAPN